MGVPWNSRAGRAVAKALGIAPPAGSPVEDLVAAAVADWCGRNGLPFPVRQLRAIPGRKLAFDLAWPAAKVAVEFDGGTYSGGRHVRPDGFERDHVKRALAQLDGWIVLCVTYRQFHKGLLFEWLARAFELRGGTA